MRRNAIPLLVAGAVAAAGFLIGPAGSSADTSYGVAPSHVMLDPQR